MTANPIGTLKSLTSDDVDRISVLAQVSEVLNSKDSAESMMERLIQILCRAMGADRGLVELFGREGGNHRFARDYSDPARTRSTFTFSESLVEKCVAQEQPLVLLDSQQAVPTESIIAQGIRSVLIHPLKGHEGLRGVLYLDSLLTAGAFTESDLEMLGVFANMVGVALERHDKERALARAQRSLADAAHGTIVRLSKVAEFRDSEGGAHLDRVSLYTELLATRLGMEPNQVSSLTIASMMHDIGKLGIPDSILLKPGRFNDYERQIMQEHTTIGAQILSGSDSELLQLAEVVALTHHEKWDGTGYPQRLKGAEIPLPGRIVALADVFDAVTSRRRYKSAYPLEDAFTLIGQEAGSHFDPRLAQLFLAAREQVEAIFWENPDPPCKAVEVVAEPSGVPPEVAQRKALSGAAPVLLVDPDPYLGETLATEATRRDVGMQQASSIAQARALLEEEAPAVLILEVTLEGALGFLDEALLKNPRMDVIVLTGDDSFSRRVEVSRRGVRTYLQKPAPSNTVLDYVLVSLGGGGVGTARVLVLDDDPVQLKVVSGILRRHDYEVTCLSDPLELWDKLSEIDPALLILDLEMPRLSGFEVCKVIRASGRWTHLPIVVITGHKDALTYSRALEAGADDVLAKPLKPRTLMSRLETRLRRTEAVRRGASHEPVTGLAALTHAREAGHQLTSLALRLKSTVTVGLVRIEGFEELKSQAGRAAVDRVQREVAAVLLKGMRSEDILTRYEDGCFMAAFPGSTKEHAQVFLESVNARLVRAAEGEDGSKGTAVLRCSWKLVSSPEDGPGLSALLGVLSK